MRKPILSLIAILVVSSIAVAIFWNSKPAAERPQESTKPFPYRSEEVTFRNTQADITLAGTLTLPSKEGASPAVVLITGSGAQNRDAELSGHKPFLVLADHLTRNGIAVLRYDDRGFGQSTGNFHSATPLDFASDVESAVAYLKSRKEVDENRIGLVGHSEGGIVAPLVASASKDVSFVVLLAGLGVQGHQELMRQAESTLRAFGAGESEIQEAGRINGGIFEIMAQRQEIDALKAELTKYAQEHFEAMPTYLKPPGVTKEQFVAGQIDFMSSPGYRFIWNYDPAPTLEKVGCPVLALNGGKDLQVTPRENLAAIGNALRRGGNTNVTLKELPNLNHFFQECETGSPAEYATIEQTFSPIALAEISTWILKQVK